MIPRRMNTGWSTFEYTYDVLNHLKTVKDPLNRIDPLNNTTTYAYDERDLLWRVTDANSPSAGVTQYDYTSNGSLSAVTDAQGNKTAYIYDGFDRLAGTDYADGSDEEYFYDKGSNRTTQVTPENVTIAYAYDALNRLTKKTYPDGAMTVTFVYDAGSRLKRIYNSFSDVTYSYNKLNLATKETQKFGTLTFAVTSVYDKAGNRVTADGVSYLSNALNQYMSVGVATINYDNNGNLTQDNTSGASYAYDAESRLVQAVKGTTVAQYRYDGFNRRVSKDVNGVKVFYVYDGDEIVEERGASGAVIADYVYGPQIDEVLTMTRGGQTYYYFATLYSVNKHLKLCVNKGLR
jgi:YD repeat-containing protein